MCQSLMKRGGGIDRFFQMLAVGAKMADVVKMIMGYKDSLK